MDMSNTEVTDTGTTQTINGITIKTDQITRNGQKVQAVYWSDNWAEIDKLVDSGHLRRIHEGPGTFGHVTYVLNEQGFGGRNADGLTFDEYRAAGSGMKSSADENSPEAVEQRRAMFRGFGWSVS